MKKPFVWIFTFVFVICAALLVDYWKQSSFATTPKLERQIASNGLAMKENITAVGTSTVTVNDSYYRLRYIVSQLDIYPQINIEIFEVTGGEGEPIKVNVFAHLTAMSATQLNEGDAEVENIQWQPDAKLAFKIGKKSCVYDMGKGLVNLGPNLSKAQELQVSCK